MSSDDDFGTVEDGMGSAWPLCRANCQIQVVRPGKAQCDPCEQGDDADDLDARGS